MKLKILLLILLLSFPSVFAAEITGKTYSPELTLLKNVVVEINTEPKQVVVTDPSYLFTINPGEYRIKARYKDDKEEYYLEENVTVKQEGKFYHDIILFYDLEEIDLDVPDLVNINFQRNNPSPTLTIIIIFIIAILIGFLSQWFLRKKNIRANAQKKDIKEDLNEILKILRQNDGRLNQKDLRKQLSLSEAKVSLMISELESLRMVKRIKKGRANIIVLV